MHALPIRPDSIELILHTGPNCADTVNKCKYMTISLCERCDVYEL